jgi:hypothetical protein
MTIKSIYNSVLTKFLFIIIIISATSFAQKTDIVILFNNDKMTGEVKGLQYGLLEFSTDNMGTIMIEWEKIKSITTDKIFEIELTDGRNYYGSLLPDDKPGMILVKGVTLETSLFLEYIVKITRIKESFWEILDGYIMLGASYNKGSDVGELSFGMDAIYRTKIRRHELLINSVLSATGGNSTSKNQNASYSFSWFLEKKWYWSATARVEQNTTLGLNLRATIGGAIGYDVLQSNENNLNASGGLAANREWYEDETSPENNLVLVITSKYQFFIYDSPSVNLYSFINIYPYLTNFGRINLDYNLSFDWEIINDFYWDLSFYLNYDNEPQSVNASKVDYSIESGIKYNL